MVHARLTSYLEDNGYIPDTMFGFRQHLSTQDILLLLKEDIIDRLDRHHKSCILALDVKGAFDNVKHEKILENLQTHLPKLQQTVTQVTHLVKRITNQRRGLKEQDTLRIIQALITSRMTYGTPYLALKSAEIKKMDIMIRKGTKTALGVPFMASTDKLLKLGVHNTWEEMAEAHKASQLERLKLTSTGRAVLRYLNYSETYIADTDEKARLPLELREAILVARIPRNMHPSYHKERREARSKALLRKYAKDPNTRYTDAARYPDHTAFAVSVTDQRGRELASATIPARNPETAEEAAIALAMTTCSDRALIFTDSQAACRNFQKGRVSATALKILKTRPQLPDAYVTWIPGHEGMAGNEAAHAAAREHTSRAFLPPNIRAATGTEEVPTTYRAVLEHYRLERRRYPPPHLDLTKEESVILRRLQTITYAHGIIMHRIYPTQFPYLCPYCDIPDTLPHMILECPCEDRRPDPPVGSQASSTIHTSAPQNNASAHTTGDHDIAEKWEALLVSEDPENQKNLVNRAKTAATARGFLD
ncbi:uncharacterized protein LOC144180160 [Haemaphysalis longicornis]